MTSHAVLSKHIPRRPAVPATWLAAVAAEASGLLAHWPMFEPTGTTMFDYSGNNRNGTYEIVNQGAATLLSDGSGALSTDFPGTGGSGTGQCRTPNAAWMDISALTIVQWIRPDTVAAGTRSIHVIDDGGTNATFKYRATVVAAVPNFSWQKTVLGTYDGVSGGSLVAGTIYCLAFIHTGSGARILVDGVQVASGGTSAMAMGRTGTMRWGAMSNFDRFDGRMGPSAMWNRDIGNAACLTLSNAGRGI